MKSIEQCGTKHRIIAVFTTSFVHWMPVAAPGFSVCRLRFPEPGHYVSAYNI